MKQIKDSGKRTKFKTGSQRDTQEGKGYFELMCSSYYGMLEIAQIFELGAKKYEPRNWEKGQPLSQYIRSALRHLCKAAAGAKDENHLAMAGWNIICAIETRKRIELGILPKELDDIPDYGEKYTEGFP